MNDNNSPPASRPQTSDGKIQPWKAFWPPKPEAYTPAELEKMPWLTWAPEPEKPDSKPCKKRGVSVRHFTAFLSHPNSPRRSIKMVDDMAFQASDPLKESKSSVKGVFWYFKREEKWDHEKPYLINIPASALPPGQPTTNEISEASPKLEVHDFRNEEQSLANLDSRGFALVHDPNQYGPDVFSSYEAMRADYVPKVQEWLKTLLGAEEVLVTTLTIRKRDPYFPKYTWGTAGDSQPIQGVHIDYTPRFAQEKLEDIVGKERASQLSGRRFQILNIWRPIFGPMRDWPLGIIDFKSLDYERDLIAADVIYPHYIGETFHVFYHPSHKWYYVPDQMPDEVSIFKSFDSKRDVATACAHAAFDLELAEVQRCRESTDVLALVIYPEA